ncbi:hypothetical protein HN51_01605 [Ectopseudomonas mendocina]|nr:hypothetical protein HN51_01605 [Pseudomonas mendocina]
MVVQCLQGGQRAPSSDVFILPWRLMTNVPAFALALAGHRLIVPLLTKVTPWLLKWIELFGCIPLQCRLMLLGR